MTDRKIHLMRPFVGAEELELVKHVFDTQFLTEGDVTRQFEREFAEYVGARYAVAVTSCTTGMELCLRAMGIGPGDRVLVPDFTHPATADCVLAVGALPVLADVNLCTYNLDVSILDMAMANDGYFDALIPVSWGGNPLTVDLYSFCEDFAVPMIEDAACSVGAITGSGDKTGSLADATVFSFHPRKVMTTGEGGMVTTNNKGIYEMLMGQKNFGSFGGTFATWGTNYKLCNILAAIGLGQLAKLEQNVNIRIAKAKRYNDLLCDCEHLHTPMMFETERQTFQSYCIFIVHEGWRDKLRADLAAMGIETQIGTYALHQLPAFLDLPHATPVIDSSQLADNLLTLPLHHELTDDDQDYVVDSVKALLAGYAI